MLAVSSRKIKKAHYVTWNVAAFGRKTKTSCCLLLIYEKPQGYPKEWICQIEFSITYKLEEDLTGETGSEPVLQ